MQNIMFGLKGDEVTGSAENYIMTGLVICTAHPMMFG